MKNKFIRKWLVILTVAAMMIPAGIPANAETVEEGENIAPTAGISAETPNVTAETQKEEISAEMPDMTAEYRKSRRSFRCSRCTGGGKDGRGSSDRRADISDSYRSICSGKRRGRTAAFRKCRSFTTDLADKECDVRYKWIYCIGGSRIQRQFYVYESGNIQYCRKRKD